MGTWRHLCDVGAGLAVVQPGSENVTVIPGHCGTSFLGGSSTKAAPEFPEGRLRENQCGQHRLQETEKGFL